jgi:hypothetical protein
MKQFTINAYFKKKIVQNWDDTDFKQKKKMQDWEVNARFSIPNAKTLVVKTPKKAQSI